VSPSSLVQRFLSFGANAFRAGAPAAAAVAADASALEEGPAIMANFFVVSTGQDEGGNGKATQHDASEA
jgi:hypothetical protein